MISPNCRDSGHQFWLKMENILMANSGMDVPNATIVSPTMMGDISSHLAKSEEPCTKYCAPLNKKMRLAKNDYY